jgi:hypothetical protein
MNWRPQRGRGSFALSVGRLLGHLAAGTTIFIAVLLLAWILSLVFKYLNSVAPFPVEISTLFEKFEIALFCADIVVSGMVLSIGVWWFLWDVIVRRD